MKERPQLDQHLVEIGPPELVPVTLLEGLADAGALLRRELAEGTTAIELLEGLLGRRAAPRPPGLEAQGLVVEGVDGDAQVVLPPEEVAHQLLVRVAREDAQL